jgi:hypothetical protein
LAICPSGSQDAAPIQRAIAAGLMAPRKSREGQNAQVSANWRFLRILAQSRFENVELEVARDVGEQTVIYVGNIYKYYVAYELAANERMLKDYRYPSSYEIALAQRIPQIPPRAKNNESAAEGRKGSPANHPTSGRDCTPMIAIDLYVQNNPERVGVHRRLTGLTRIFHTRITASVLFWRPCAYGIL